MIECVAFVSAQRSLQYHIIETVRAPLEARFAPLPDVEWWALFHRCNPIIVWNGPVLELDTYGAERVFQHARDYYLATLSEQEPEYYSGVTRYLARKVLACSCTSRHVLQTIEQLPLEQAFEYLRQHVLALSAENLQAEQVHYAVHYNNPYASVPPQPAA